MSENTMAWVAVILVTLIIGTTIVATVSARAGIKAEVKKAEIEAMRAFAASSSSVAEQLGAIESRLAAIEKTLTDIP